MIRIRHAFLLGCLFPILACGENAPDAEPAGSTSEATDTSLVEVALQAQLPDQASGRRMMWSPYGKQLPLAESGGGLEGSLQLGPQGTPPIALRLTRSQGASHYDGLLVDFDRDGRFQDDEALETTPTERNFKYWSSFETVVDLPVEDPVTGKEEADPYPLSFWYVEDPRIPDEEPVIRFSRRGWMEGRVTLDGVAAYVLLTEGVMDGVYGDGDAWALAGADSVADLFTPAYSRDVDEHAWLFEKAYRVREVDPSGRRLLLEPFDPGITRVAEEEMNDELRVDREAPRSGRVVSFLQDFAAAEARAREEGRALLVDFETTWCGPCKLMDEWVYTADAVVDAASGLVAVKVDGDERLDLKERFGVTGFPTVILLSPDGTEIRRASGYVSVVEMAEFLGGD